MPALAVAVGSGIGLLQLESLNLAVACALIVASVWRRGFWLVAVPILLCFGGLELSVFLEPGREFVTPLNPPVLPDTWLMCFSVRSISYWAKTGDARIQRGFLLLGALLALMSVFASLWFLVSHGGLPFLNKAPVKVLVFTMLAGVVFSESVRTGSGDLVWRGVVYGTVIGAIQRLFIVGFFPVKEPGVYSYIGVFVTACMIFLASRSRAGSPHRLLSLAFWSLILLMHLSASRTQLALLAVTVVILLIVLAHRSLPVVLVVATAVAAAIPFVQRDFVNYLLYKASFFLAVLDPQGYIGASASVRRSTFLNLIDGSQTDAVNLLVGRGWWGYLDFSAHPDGAIFSESAFSPEEHALGNYYHLHFFLNEVLFNFGLAGVVLLALLMLLAASRIRHPLELVLLVYFLFNFMFRLELLVLVPVVLWAWRGRLAAGELRARLEELVRPLSEFQSRGS